MIQTGRPRNRRSIFCRTVAKNDSLIQSAQTGYGVLRSLGNGGYFLGGIKRSGVLFPFAIEIKNEWSSTSTRHMLLWSAQVQLYLYLVILIH
jgi:hypothetical protein